MRIAESIATPAYWTQSNVWYSRCPSPPVDKDSRLCYGASAPVLRSSIQEKRSKSIRARLECSDDDDDGSKNTFIRWIFETRYSERQNCPRDLELWATLYSNHLARSCYGRLTNKEIDIILFEVASLKKLAWQLSRIALVHNLHCYSHEMYLRNIGLLLFCFIFPRAHLIAFFAIHLHIYFFLSFFFCLFLCVCV